MAQTILVIDDSADLRTMVKNYLAAPGRVYSRLELLNQVQGEAFEEYENNVDVHVRHLRQKIEPDPGEPRYIETVYGVGYRFTADE